MNRKLLQVAALVLVAGGIGCSSKSGGEGPPPANVSYAYVLMGPDGVAVARAITADATCPVVTFGGVAMQMTVHAAAATVPARPMAYDDIYSPGPAVFPVTTCDATVPAGARSATIGSRSLPLPKPVVQRIIVLGDTGCRMKAKLAPAHGDYQACDDPTAWPFQAVSDVAASFAPDLVVHVGDFHYRETPCPAGSPCAGVTNYGFGWASWEPDFFAPAESLLAAAPWIMIRGDHEICDRGGQGWWRFLDPRPIAPGQDCNAAADDMIGNYSEPYLVPLDADTVAVVLDTGAVSDGPFDPTSAESIIYGWQLQEAFYRAARWSHSLVLVHQPILAYNSGGSGSKGKCDPGNGELQGVLDGLFGDLLFPGAVDAVLSGHLHMTQFTSFQESLPPTFVLGNGGTSLAPLCSSETPATPYPKGTLAQALPQWREWGFATMERTASGWTATLYDLNGTVITACSVTGRAVACLD
jgi:hypothetical protein